MPSFCDFPSSGNSAVIQAAPKPESGHHHGPLITTLTSHHVQSTEYFSTVSFFNLHWLLVQSSHLIVLATARPLQMISLLAMLSDSNPFSSQLPVKNLSQNLTLLIPGLSLSMSCFCLWLKPKPTVWFQDLHCLAKVHLSCPRTWLSLLQSREFCAALWMCDWALCQVRVPHICALWQGKVLSFPPCQGLNSSLSIRIWTWLWFFCASFPNINIQGQVRGPS